MSDATFDEFRAAVLAPWAGDDSTACQAAAEAMWAVACKYARTPRGSIVIDVPDQTSVRSVMAYVEAMLKDQEQLSRLQSKWHDGEVTIGGKKVLCLPRGTSRRPRGVLARIEMKGGDVAAPTVLPPDHNVAKTIIHAIITAVNGEGDMKIADKLAASIRPGLDAKAFVKLWDATQRAKRAAQRETEYPTYDDKHPARDHFHFLKATSVPTVPRPAPGPVGADGYYTKEEEERLARLRETRDEPPPPIISGPRGRWKR